MPKMLLTALTQQIRREGEVFGQSGESEESLHETLSAVTKREISPIETAPWQTAAGNAESGAGADDRAREACGTFQNTGVGWWNKSDIGATLRTPTGGESVLANVVVQAAGFKAGQSKAGSIGADDREGTENCLTPWDVQSRRVFNVGGKWPALYSGEGGGHGYVLIEKNSAGFKAGQSKAGSIGWQDECAATLSAQASGTEPTVCIKKQYLFENHSQDTRFKGPLKVSPMLPAQLGTGGNNTPFVVEGTPVYCLQGNGIDRALTAGCNGKDWKEDTSYTLNTIDRPAVVFAQQAYDKFENFEKASTLKACGDSYGGGSENLVCETIKTRYIVRRLTPTECARLQGFPDKWGHPDKKETLTDDEYRFWLEVRNTHAAINGKAVKEYTKEQMLTWYNKLHSDSAEYKMWGNGISLPVALYVLSGIAGHSRRLK